MTVKYYKLDLEHWDIVHPAAAKTKKHQSAAVREIFIVYTAPERSRSVLYACKHHIRQTWWTVGQTPKVNVKAVDENVTSMTHQSVRLYVAAACWETTSGGRRASVGPQPATNTQDTQVNTAWAKASMSDMWKSGQVLFWLYGLHIGKYGHTAYKHDLSLYLQSKNINSITAFCMFSWYHAAPFLILSPDSGFCTQLAVFMHQHISKETWYAQLKMDSMINLVTLILIQHKPS